MFAKLDVESVFLDISMPGVDGEEVASLVLAQDPEVKIVVMTGIDPADPRITTLRCLGAFEVLEKPVRSQDVERVLELIGRERGAEGRIR